jgi:PilZ domain
MERRRGVRFEIQLSCRFKRRGAREMLDATTLNLGRLGALVAAGGPDYVDAKTIPEPGDPVQLELVLPAHSLFGQRCLACEAIAVRSTTEDGRRLVALQFHRIEIRRVLARSVAAGQLELI